MPEQFEPQHPDVEQLAKDVEKRLEQSEGKPEVHRDVIREIIREKIQQQTPQSPSSAKATTDKQTQSQKPSSSVLPNYMQNATPEEKGKVESLLRLAYSKGIEVAIKEAQKGDAFTLDAFHDALTDKLYDEFKSRGILK